MVAAAIALIMIYLIIYYLFGFGLFYVAGGRRTCNPMWIGMFAYAILFFLEAFPMKVVQMPLKAVGAIWIGTVIGILALIVYYLHQEIIEDLKQRVLSLRQHKWSALLALAVILIALIYVETQRQAGSPWDNSYYLGEVNTSVYEGVTETVAAIDGTEMTSFSPLYVMETYLMHSAVICTITGIPAAVEVRTVMTAVVILVFFALVWDIGKKLFGKEYWKSAVLFLVVLLVYLFSDSYYWPGTFFLIRTYEGKTILANLFVPAAFYWFMCLWEEDTRENWMGMFLTMSACFTYSMSAIFLMPVALAGYGLVLLIHRKNWKTVRNLVLCVLPCLLVAVAYVLMSKNVIQLLIF